MASYKAVLAACSYALQWPSALQHLEALQGLGTEPEELQLQRGIVAKACAVAAPHVAKQLLEEQQEVPPEWLSVLHWQQALEHFGRQQKESVRGLGPSPRNTIDIHLRCWNHYK